jgi:hypothetical protein
MPRHARLDGLENVGAESSWRLRRALQKVIYAMIFEERRAEPMAQQKSINEGR